MHFWPRQCRIQFFYVNSVQKAHLIKIINILLCSKSVLNESPQKGTQTLHFINIENIYKMFALDFKQF